VLFFQHPWRLAATLALFCTSAPAFQDALELKVKAAMLVTFTKFVTAPPVTGERQLTVCAMSGDPMIPVLRPMLAAQKVRDLPLQWVELKELPEKGVCDVLYVSSTVPDPALRRFLVQHYPGTLTVSDRPDFVRDGGMIGLVPDKDRLRFEINLAAARQANIQISSQLLALAVRVIQ
jgi:hypothetical protein